MRNPDSRVTFELVGRIGSAEPEEQDMYTGHQDIIDVQARGADEDMRVYMWKMARDEKLAAESKTLTVHPSKSGKVTVALRGTATGWEIWGVSRDGKRHMVWPVQKFTTPQAAKDAANAVWARF